MKVYRFTKEVLIPAKNEEEALEILQSNLDVDEYDCSKSDYWDCEELDEEVAEAEVETPVAAAETTVADEVEPETSADEQAEASEEETEAE